MEPVTAVLSGIVVAVVSGGVVRILGNKNNVKDRLCVERRSACSSLIIEKIDNLAKDVTDIKKAVNKTV